MNKTPLAAWLLGLALITNLQAAETMTETRDVEVRMVVLDIDEVDNVKQSFTANVALTLRWQDKSLVHEGSNSIRKPLIDIWYPSIQIINQQRLVETFPKIVEVQPDGVVLYRQRYWGVFSQRMELSGQGRARGYDPAHAEWHGPFKSLEEARKLQKNMKVVVRKECRCV